MSELLLLLAISGGVASASIMAYHSIFCPKDIVISNEKGTARYSMHNLIMRIIKYKLSSEAQCQEVIRTDPFLYDYYGKS